MAYPRRRSLSLDDGDFDRNSGSRMPSHRHLPGEPSQHDGYPAQSISPLAPPPSATAASAMGGLYSSLYSVIFSLVHLVLTVVLSPVIKTAHAPHQKTSPTLRSEQRQQPEHDDDGSRGSHGDLYELEAGNYPTSAVGSGSGMTSISSYSVPEFKGSSVGSSSTSSTSSSGSFNGSQSRPSFSNVRSSSLPVGSSTSSSHGNLFSSHKTRRVKSVHFSDETRRTTRRPPLGRIKICDESISSMSVQSGSSSSTAASTISTSSRRSRSFSSSSSSRSASSAKTMSVYNGRYHKRVQSSLGVGSGGSGRRVHHSAYFLD
ncbi:predicted protein [Thalassiosira pseudonana CCMP1335]|uniref:Uncharacterized protein n=1 Tax=Thalassiosira pseudonana TaxID=35128 RepID=B8CFV8_THAPS|nr:predicted protein [Thalassiosira pseudonana CCMP1335]EED87865.1 predicted protein [Thalassiosira pseudonana CCMP1335]|eukprot:g8839.t1 g8839   contig34:241987-242937(+)